MSNGDHDSVGAGRAALGRIGGREWAVGFAWFMLAATACGNNPTPFDPGDAGHQGATSGGGSGNGSSSTGSSGSNGVGSGSGAGNSSASSGGASSGSGGSSSGSAGSGATLPVPCGDGGLPTGSGSSLGSSTDTGASCPISASGVRVTEVDVGITYSYQEVDTPLSLLAISPIPGGGSRLAFMGSDAKVHVVLLDNSDNVVTGSTFALAAHDFQDIYADNNGGVALVTRDAMGGGTNNCGNPANLCSLTNPTNYSCWDMYLVGFDGCGNETWATELTTSNASLPPYSTGTTGPLSLMIWWYAHNGRIAFDGTNFAAYYGVAITVKNQGGMSCMDIHQGDEMRLVNANTGKLVGGGFDI